MLHLIVVDVVDCLSLDSLNVIVLADGINSQLFTSISYRAIRVYLAIIYLSLRLHDTPQEQQRKTFEHVYIALYNIQGMRESEKNERGCLLYWSLSPQETFSVVHLVYIGNIIPGELSMNGLESLQPQHCGFLGKNKSKDCLWLLLHVSVISSCILIVCVVVYKGL